MFYETLDNITADAGIRVKASSLEELFCKALLATFNEITDIDRVEVREYHNIEAESPVPFLLADLINRALLLHETKGFVARKCEVLELTENKARLKLGGEIFNPRKHTSKLVIKAATYHMLKVEKRNGVYVADVVFDI